MRRHLTLALAGGALALGLMIAAPAEAGHVDWSFGAGFRVGGLHFQVGFDDSGRFGPNHGPYFHTRGSLSYPGHRCGAYCLRSGRDFYHHYSCPLVAFHFGRYGYSPGHYLEAYPPAGFFFGGIYGSRYRDHRYDSRLRQYGRRSPSRGHAYYLYRDRYRDRSHYRDRGDRRRDRQYDRRDRRDDRRRQDRRRDRRRSRRHPD